MNESEIRNSVIRRDNEYNSYSFTIRPRCGATDEVEQEFVKFLTKNFKYQFLCAEKEDEARHLHGQVWMDVSRKKGDFTKSLKRVQERCDSEWSPASSKVLAGGVKIAYSKNWIEEYLSKEDKWILNNPPEDEENYYPSQEEQEKVKSKANAVDQGFHHWSELFKESEYAHSISKESVGQWFHDAMFVSKIIKVQVDPKKRIQNRDCLYHYLKSSKDGWKITFRSNEEKANAQLIQYAIDKEPDP